MSLPNIIVIDADHRRRAETCRCLLTCGYTVLDSAGTPAALDGIDAAGPSVILAALDPGGPPSALLIRDLRSRFSESAIVAVLPEGAESLAALAGNAGAYDSIAAPFAPDSLAVVIERALERRSLLDPILNLRAEIDRNPGFSSIIGKSKPLLHILSMALRAARTDSVVLITGETGTGKELLARAIHSSSRRRDKPLVTVNCGAIPPNLLESELFGHTRGSFTGAIADKPGRAEIASGGTLFLDEIGELPFAVQVKLLRLVQHGEIEKVGATSSASVNVRIVAASNRNLWTMVEAGTFREDLYYRLAVIPLELPPLRSRPDDIPQLALRLFERLKEKHGRHDLTLPASLVPYLTAYHWPGNVRELENVLERLVVLTSSSEISRDDLPENLRRKTPPPASLPPDLPPDRVSLDGLEKEVIFRALKKFSWNQTHAAQYLNISRRTLIYRMEKYGLKTAAGRK